jgi:tetratricopeptide (TPR) repeat protein
MSSISINDDITSCANCGKGEEASINLKSCTACKLVKYCSRECQIAHRPQHKKECKKRAAELHDEELFKQPPPLFEDCPICFLRMPDLNFGWQYQLCCGKTICSGCIHAPLYDDQGNEVNNEKCPFCRTPISTSDEEVIKREKKRFDSGDPIATFNVGIDYRDGTNGYPQDYTKALELFHRASKLGHFESYCNIGCAYDYGEGVEIDKKKSKHFFELAAKGGSAPARYNLANYEAKEGNYDRALKHFMIAIRYGHAGSLKTIKQMYTHGYATKGDYTKALQLYQAYLGEIKSDQRDKAAAFSDMYKYY